MTKMYRFSLMLMTSFLFLTGMHSIAQTVVPVVPVGKGSYGNGTPFDLVKNTWGDDGNWKPYNQMMALHDKWPARWHVAKADTNTRALPTNDEWTSALFQQNGGFGGLIWNHPTLVQLKAQGTTVGFPAKWAANGKMDGGWSMQVEPAGGTLTPATKCTIKNWTDWTTVAELADGANKMDVTFGHGVPYVWFEPTFNPTLYIADAPYTSDGVSPITFPYTGDVFVGNSSGQMYAIFMPPNTTVTKNGSTFKLAFSGASKYFIVGLLKSPADMPTLKTYAYVKPVDTQVKWTYNQAAATMNVNWAIKGINLKGEANTDVLQGFIPHHYQRTLSAPAFNGMTYLTAKGTMKCAVGKSFDFSYRFTGILPNVPAPKKNAADKFPFDSTYFASTLTAASGREATGTEIYWGLKPLLSQSRYALFATLTNHPKADVLKTKVKDALSDWLTYTPGETAHAFYKYDESSQLGAIVGFDPGLWSSTFTDHDMCYGYMLNAAAHYSMTDPAFLTDYGPMLRLLAKHINNWERGDKSFPFLRIMDPWNGHSWAGGPNGSDVESVSECMQMAAATFLIGEMVGDQGMRDAGAFIHTSMSRAYDQYIRDVDHMNFAPSFPLPVAAKLDNDGPAQGNYTNTEGIYWINWIPYSTPMNFFFSDTAAARDKYNKFMTAHGSNISNWGADFYNNLTEYLNGFDNPKALQMWNDYFPKYQGNELNGITYYYLQSTSNLGSIDWTRWTSSPLSQVYFNKKTGQYTYIAYNPTATEQTVTAYNNGAVLGTFKVPPYTTVATHLDAVLTKLKITSNSDIVQPSATMQLTAVGLDQYGGSMPVTGLTWSVVYGAGSISNTGLYTATSAKADSIVVQAVKGILKATYVLKVNEPRKAYKMVVTPAYQKIVPSGSVSYVVKVYDQYNAEMPVAGLVWASSGGGNITQSGVFTSSGATGMFTNTVTLGNLSYTTVVMVAAPANNTTNIALNKPSTADVFVSANTASKANDGDVNTRWETTSKAVDNNAQHWWSVNLQNAYDLSKVTIIWETAAASKYAVQVSMDGIKWTTADSTSTGTNGATTSFDLYSKNITAQYIRVWCYIRTSDFGFSIKEFQAYGLLHTTKPLNKLIVNPGIVELKTGQTMAFTASGYDMDGNPLSSPGTWSVNGGGTINASGVFTAQTNGTYTVTYTSGSITGTATVKIADNSAKQLTSFGFASPAVSGSISGNNILVVVPNGTNRASLVANFTSSPSSIVTVGGVTQTSGVTVNNFTGPLTYTVKAQDGSTTTYTVTVTIATDVQSAEDRSLRVFPNPTSGVVTIETERNFDYISVNNIVGKEVLFYKANAASVSLDMSSLPKGIYLMKVSCGGQVLDKKIVVE